MTNKINKWLYDHPKTFGFICVTSFLTSFTITTGLLGHWYHSKN